MSPTKKDVGIDLGLNDEEKAELHRMARSAIKAGTSGKSVPSGVPASSKLADKRGAFVSLYKQGMLRGCIGTLEPNTPLYETIVEMAQASAFRDPRFRPVTEEELPYLELEISVLTPLQEIKNPEEIKVGLHGILIKKGYFSGLLLPQVATERDWDRLTFLRETCRKAGLPADAWKDEDAKIYVFSADVF